MTPTSKSRCRRSSSTGCAPPAGMTRTAWRKPASNYADKVSPLAETHKNADRYLKRLMERPSYARTLDEARPYLHLFPKE